MRSSTDKCGILRLIQQCRTKDAAEVHIALNASRAIEDSGTWGEIASNNQALRWDAW